MTDQILRLFMEVFKVTPGKIAEVIRCNNPGVVVIVNSGRIPQQTPESI